MERSGAPDKRDMCERVLMLANERALTIGTAESCTGGLLCAALTDVPGSSAVVRGGVVSYAVPVKESILGVSKSITRDPSIGVVSGECAIQMAEGARTVLDCDIAVSVTGIAGPGGAEPGKPVGTVFLGVSSARGSRYVELHLLGNRGDVREGSVMRALNLYEEELEWYAHVGG